MFNLFASDVGSDGSPIAEAIMKATDPMNMYADWSKNLEICDMINGTAEGQISASKMLRRQFRAESPKTVLLALELADACVKNCNARVHAAFATKAFLSDVVALTEGKKGWEVRDEALKLIAGWGRSFADRRDTMPGFHEAWMGLKHKGVAFPEVEQSAPVFTPPPAMFDDAGDDIRAPASASDGGGSGGAGAPEASGGGRSGAGAPRPTVKEEDAAGLAKLGDDLKVVEEKVKLCREMLPQSAGVEHDETLAEVVGFLEACMPRMVELVEAGLQGLLGEDLLSLVLKVSFALSTARVRASGTPRQEPKARAFSFFFTC